MIFALIGLNVVLSIFVGIMGRKRKFGAWGYFFASMALTPFIGVLLVLGSDLRPEFKDDEADV